jgi:hypothetical protein
VVQSLGALAARSPRCGVSSLWLPRGFVRNSFPKDSADSSCTEEGGSQKLFTMSREGEMDVQWCPYRGQRGNPAKQ